MGDRIKPITHFYFIYHIPVKVKHKINPGILFVYLDSIVMKGAIMKTKKPNALLSNLHLQELFYGY